MKYYKEMSKMGCFTKSDIVTMTGNEINAKTICRKYIERGLIKRVKRDLYVTVDLSTGQPFVNKYEVATKVSKDAVIAYHSAFEYYGYSNQVFYEVYVASNTRFRDFEFNGYTIRQIHPRLQGHIKNDFNGCQITNIERTVIDSINAFEKIGGLEELLHCIEAIPHLNENELLACLKEYDNNFLYQKTGYILSYFSNTLSISNDFLLECRFHCPDWKSYLTRNYNNLTLDKIWNMYVPDFNVLLKEGINYDAI